MRLPLNLPTAAFQALHRIATHLDMEADAAATQALYVAWTLYYMGNSRNAGKVIVPNENAPSKRKSVKTGTRIDLPLRPKMAEDLHRSPLRVTLADDAHDCVEALAEHLQLTPEETVWYALMLVAEVVEAMDSLNTRQLWVVLPFGFTIKGNLLNPPR